MSLAPLELRTQPFWYFIKKHKRTVFFGLSALFITNGLETVVPWLVGKTLDKITGNASLSEVGSIVGRILVLIVALSIFRFLWRVIWANFHHRVAEDLRNRVFAQMADLGPTFFRPRKIGDLISLIANDVNSFRMGIGPGLLVIFDGSFLVVLILPFMISISPSWTWQTLALMPFVPFVVNRILGLLHDGYHQRQERFADLSGSAQEIISGIRVIKSFANEDIQTREFNQHSRAFTTACDRTAFWDAMFGPSLELPVALGSVLLLLLGTGQVISGQVTLGQFFAFYQYIQRMIWPMSAIGIGLGNVQEARASFIRIREVLEQRSDVPDEGTEIITELESLEVRALNFTYPGASHPALIDISFKISRGECLGIVGMTGAGKSTLIDLLTRQYPLPSGTILLNGISLEKISLASLRALFAIVPQEAFLFSRQVDENVALGLDSWDHDDVLGAVSQVRLEQEIATWPKAYASLVGERGVNLSGGQKQRMTLARALIRRAQLVILDDSLSAVDAKTEELILRELRGDLRQTTSIIVSHRLASVREADRILVLKCGAMESFANHGDLLKNSAIYRTLHEMQSSSGAAPEGVHE